MKRPSDYLAAENLFNDHVSGYKVRQNQLELCDAIEKTIEDGSVLAAEAGTGIGKTFAYLVPAMLSGKKVIVSTGTKHLQDQLFHTDIPRVLKALDVSVRTALLKGRANYLCLHRLKLAPHFGFINKETQSQLTEVNEWSKLTQSGDISELDTVSEDSFIWPMVTSTTDNCLGSECDFWNDCFVVKARKQAQDADMLVVNHHLMLADMVLKEDGFAELLPGSEVCIVDEAHQLHDVASRFFGETVSSRQLINLARDAIAEQVNDAPDMPELREYAEQLENHARDFRLSLGDSGARQAWMKIVNKPAVSRAIEQLLSSLKDLCAALELAAERGRGLEQCYVRCQKGLQQLKLFLPNKSDVDDAALTASSILWYETYPKSFVLHATPIDVASFFSKHTDNFSSAWLFTSATLQVNKQFSHFANSIGLENYQSNTWESPFDYKKQSLLYLPNDLPQPSESVFTKQLMQAALPVLEASKGRAFLLFTSYRAMHEAANFLHGKVSYPLFMQGELPKHELLARFREAGNGILLGTASFWEGVDVRGSALSCVVIDKLPFASPGDPVMQARIDAIRNSGGQPFMDYQVPQAVIALKQGVGRLIRDVDDHGVIMIGDPRLRQKSYGRIFLNSLPEMRTTNAVEDVTAFFSNLEPEVELEAAGN